MCAGSTVMQSKARSSIAHNVTYSLLLRSPTLLLLCLQHRFHSRHLAQQGNLRKHTPLRAPAQTHR